MSANPGFEVRRVDYEYTVPQVFTGSREPREPVITGIQSLHLTCKSCGTNWVAPKS